MVQKSKILGECYLIFVTVGTTNFKFNRLFNSIERALINLKLKTKLVVQIGKSAYKWKYRNVISKSFFTPRTMNYYFSKADRIITHGGPSSLFLISQKAKVMPLVICRLRKYKEHTDDHQKYFVTFLKKKSPTRLKKYFNDNEFIYKPILDYIKHKPDFNHLNDFLFSKSNKNLLIRRLHEYINSLECTSRIMRP